MQQTSGYVQVFLLKFCVGALVNGGCDNKKTCYRPGSVDGEMLIIMELLE